MLVKMGEIVGVAHIHSNGSSRKVVFFSIQTWLPPQLYCLVAGSGWEAHVKLLE
jgi:hypothetical protein